MTPGVGTRADAPSRTPFGQRMLMAMEDLGPLCVGIDPHPALLAQADLPDDPGGLEQFALRILEAVGGQVAAVKPQSAFFERHGSAGIAVLERVLRDCSAAGTISILDVKRGDIGSTMTAYAQAYLVDGAPLAADAVTLSPYLGFEALRPGVDAAAAHGRGVFVLALTSNPEGASVQHHGSPPVAAQIIADVAQENQSTQLSRRGAGHVGLVIGATRADALRDLGVLDDLRESAAIILAPGVGAQGATGRDLAAAFAGYTDHVLAPVSRALLANGLEVAAIRAATTALGHELRDALR
ncbi:MAG: orotidine-5'-phosphate decarboxylase [Ornithinimicrobium sp.]